MSVSKPVIQRFMYKLNCSERYQIVYREQVLIKGHFHCLMSHNGGIPYLIKLAAMYLNEDNFVW